MSMENTVTVKPEELKGLSKKILLRLDVSEEDAEITSDALVTANLRGVDTHGVRLLIKNSQGLMDGALNPKANMKILKETEVSAIFDGDNGLGQAICTKAMDFAIKKASKIGFYMVVVTRGSHCGMSAYYVTRAVKKDLIGIILSNNKASMAVSGSYDWIIGNNTLACGIPAYKMEPIVLDMSTSAISWSKIDMLVKAGNELPDRNVIRRRTEGGDIKDPKEARSLGTVLPIGGHKGSGLAIVIEVLTGILSNGPFGKDVSTVFVSTSKKENHSQTIMVIDPSIFIPIEEFKQRVDNFISEIKSAPKLNDVREILMPGERGNKEIARRTKLGIPLDEKTFLDIKNLAEKLGILNIGSICKNVIS